MAFCTSSIGVSSIGPVMPTPALLIRTSILPSFSSKFSTAVSMHLLVVNVHGEHPHRRIFGFSGIAACAVNGVVLLGKIDGNRFTQTGRSTGDQNHFFHKLLTIRLLIFGYKEQKKASYLHHTATTAYPCCVPALGEFSRSWLCRTCPLQIYAPVLGRQGKLGRIFLNSEFLNSEFRIYDVQMSLNTASGQK